MKKLELTQMENLQGGGSDYCGYLGAWVLDSTGYQGNINNVYALYAQHCMADNA